MGSIRRPEVTLEQRWEAKGQVTLLTGIQALVHVPLLQHALGHGARLEHRRLYQRLSRLAPRRLRQGAAEAGEAPGGGERRLRARR